MTKEELIDEIKIVFGSEKYPGDSHIVYDDTGFHLECVEVRRAFKDKSWQSLHENFIYEERESLFFFSKQGFKYFLPAFMIVAVGNPLKTDTLPDTIIHKLILPSEIDTVVLAEAIKRTRLDKQFSETDFYQILQNQLGQKNKSIHDFIDYMSQFDKEQSIAILHFLEYMKQYSEDLLYNPQTAIDRYWFQFEQDVSPNI